MARLSGIRGLAQRRRAHARRDELIDRARAFAPWIALGGAVAGTLVTQRKRIAHAARRATGRARGLVHRAVSPADVSDAVLVERIRSSLGPLEKKLDVPRVHVMSTKGLAILHGSVGTQAEKSVLEVAVSRVAGVKGVESHLHVGLSAADTRPSEGRRRMRALRIGRVGQRERARTG